MWKNSKINKNTLILYMCLSSVFIALNYVITAFMTIPLGGAGYLNLSDSIIFFSAVLINPIVGGIIGGISCMLADLTAGYAIYMIPTLIIKFLEGVIAGYLYRLIKIKYLNYSSLIIGGFVMAFGYFIFEALWPEMGLSIALADLGFNVLQGVIGSLIAIVLCETFKYGSQYYQNKISVRQ